MDDSRSKEDLLKENQMQKLKSQLEHLTDLQSQLDTSIQLSSQREKELQALMKGSKAVLSEKSFTESARAIFDHCKDLIGATSGYVALLSETGEENEVLFLESGGLPCDVNPELPMPIRGLRADAYKYNKAVYHNDFMNSEWVKFMPEGHVILKNVMFAPLIIEGKTVGIIGLANKAVDFNDNDAKMATGFGELAAIALQNSRNLDDRIRAEKERDRLIFKLQKTENRLELVIKGSNDAPWDWDLKTNELYYSPQWWHQIGYEVDELQADSFLWKKLMHPEDEKCVNRFFQDALLHNDGGYEIEFRLLHKAGHYVPVLSRGLITRDEAGNPVRVTGTNMDLSKYKKIENALKLNERRYKKAQKLGQVGNWEYDIRTEKFWGSDEAKRIYGFEADSNDFSFDEVEKCIPDRKRVHQALLDLIEKGKPYDLEFEIRPVNGADKRIIKSIAEIVKNQSGMPSKVTGVIHDVTVQKLADKVLQQSEEKYRHLFNSINDYILVADTDRNIIDCNQALSDGFGYTPEEIIGKKTIYLYNSRREYQEMGKELKKHLDESRFTYTINYKKKSGEFFPGETSVFYLKNAKEEIVGFIGVIRDITYRKMVEESLQMANDELKQKTAALEDMNTALKILLQKREQDNKELAEDIYASYEFMLTPFLNKLKNTVSDANQKNLIEIVDTNLNEIVSPFIKKLSDPMMNLTSTEIQISSMIKQGLSNKEIAQILVCSKRTIDSHRENIRKKLNLKNKKINLKTFLSNIQNT